MPAAICENGHLQFWRNQRGTKLSECRCSQCRGHLNRAKWERLESDGPDGAYVSRTHRIKLSDGHPVV